MNRPPTRREEYRSNSWMYQAYLKAYGKEYADKWWGKRNNLLQSDEEFVKKTYTGYRKF